MQADLSAGTQRGQAPGNCRALVSLLAWLLLGPHDSGKALEDVVDCCIYRNGTGLQIVHRKYCLYQDKV